MFYEKIKYTFQAPVSFYLFYQAAHKHTVCTLFSNFIDK